MALLYTALLYTQLSIKWWTPAYNVQKKVCRSSSLDMEKSWMWITIMCPLNAMCSRSLVSESIHGKTSHTASCSVSWLTSISLVEKERLSTCACSRTTWSLWHLLVYQAVHHLTWEYRSQHILWCADCCCTKLVPGANMHQLLWRDKYPSALTDTSIALSNSAIQFNTLRINPIPVRKSTSLLTASRHCCMWYLRLHLPSWKAVDIAFTDLHWIFPLGCQQRKRWWKSLMFGCSEVREVGYTMPRQTNGNMFYNQQFFRSQNSSFFVKYQLSWRVNHSWETALRYQLCPMPGCPVWFEQQEKIQEDCWDQRGGMVGLRVYRTEKIKFVSWQHICACVLDPWVMASSYEELELSCDEGKALQEMCDLPVFWLRISTSTALSHILLICMIDPLHHIATPITTGSSSLSVIMYVPSICFAHFSWNHDWPEKVHIPVTGGWCYPHYRSCCNIQTLHFHSGMSDLDAICQLKYCTETKDKY